MDNDAAKEDVGRDGHPARFGRFRVIAPLARGGMGMVYLVADEGGHEAVVKTIRRDLAADPSYLARFRNEAQAALRFRSNLVARVWECDANADPPWIALEKIDGPTLRELVRGGQPLGTGALSAFAADLAEGVHAFYDQGLAHGDLTPSNIVIQDGNRVKILDLGLARPTADETATGDLPAMGTPYWLAPEVAAGFAPDNLSDVNQWGKVVLFAGTGYPQVGPVDIGEALSQLSPPLRSIVERSMSPMPDARPSPEDLWNRTRERRLTGTGPPTVALLRSRLTLEPGGHVETTATLTNMSSAPEVYTIDLLGPLAASGYVDPPRLELEAGGVGQVEVGFDLPDDSSVRPNDWPFGLRCAVGADADRSAVAEGTVRVRRKNRLHLEALHRSPQGRWAGRYSFRLENRGNTRARVRLTASELGDQLSFAVSPALADLDPTEATIARVKVRTRRPFLSGDPVDHRFQVSASVERRPDGAGAATASIEAAFEQVPVVSRRLGWVVLGAVLAAAVVAALAVLLGYLSAGA
jgi:hypothetical protein